MTDETSNDPADDTTYTTQLTAFYDGSGNQKYNVTIDVFGSDDSHVHATHSMDIQEYTRTMREAILASQRHENTRNGPEAKLAEWLTSHTQLEAETPLQDVHNALIWARIIDPTIDPKKVAVYLRAVGVTIIRRSQGMMVQDVRVK